MSGVVGPGVEGGTGDIPPGDVVVGNGEVVPVRNSAGADSHNGTAVVSGDPLALQGINLPATTAMVDNNEGIPITRADGTGSPFATAAARVANGVLASASVPATVAVVNNSQAALNIEQFDNSGTVGGIARVAANVLTMQLANATTRVAIHAGPVTVRAANGKTAPATIAVAGGAFENFPLSQSTDGILSSGNSIEIENLAESSAVNGTVSIVAGVVQARLPAFAGLVADGVGMIVPVTGVFISTITPQVSATGVITGFVLS